MLHGPSARYAGGSTGPVKFSEEEYANASYLEQFKYKAREWWSAVQKLQQTKAPTPELETSRKRLLDLATTVKDAIVKVTSLSDSLKIPGLAAAPLVPIILVAGALSAIAYWTSQFASYKKKLLEYQYQRELVSQGVSPEEAARLAKEQAAAGEKSSGPLALLLDNWQFIAVGVAGLFVYRMLKK